MAKKGYGNLLEETISVTPWSRKLYYDAEEFWKESEGLHYAYLIFRTLRGDYEQFQPDAIFYVGKSPAAYLKKVNSNKIPDGDVRKWQRFLWNQTVVPMLIVQIGKKVQVYTAYTVPKEESSQERITSILEDVADTLELDQLLTAIEAGTIYEEKPEAFYKLHAVDRYLLDNLKVAAEQLAGTQEGGASNQENLEFAHQFLTRLFFVCYLIERGMIKGEHFDDEALKKLCPKTESQDGYFLRHLFDELDTYSKRRDVLCKLFVRVKERFNGSLFPDNGIKGEKDNYNEKFISVLNLFLHGHNLPDSQLMLGFWAYDFSVIPIETISAVYESFLGSQGKIRESLGEDNTKRVAGAYYTPLHLAELTVDIALENAKKPIHELKVLDPACGSGVFLVSLFGRMVESLRRQENHIEKRRSIGWARKLLPMLGQLCGIDVSSTACHITCFSLYLALLEQVEPKHVEYLYDHGEKLPPLLSNTVKNSFNTICHGNLFDPQLFLKENDFDIVIGNPPWVSREKQKDKDFLKWRANNPNVLGPDKQIAHGFMWKVRDYLSGKGVACLLLPSAVLFNDHTNQFQKEWFSFVTVERVVNFSDLRWLLFEDANHPCLAIRFLPKNSTIEGPIRYESPKVDVRSQQGGPVYIREEDTTNLCQKNLLAAAIKGNAPVSWKLHYWGSWRDQRLLSRLNNLPKLRDLADEIGKGKRWNKGQGIQPNGSDDNPVWWKPSTPYLNSREDVDLAMTTKGLKTARQANIPCDYAHRPREKELFVGPKVLLAKGSQRVIFCSQTVLFRDTFTAITGKKGDEHELRFLSAVLGSKLIYYYLFHTNSNLGIYRPQIFPNEFISIPFYLSEEASDPQKAKKIITEAANVIEMFEKDIAAKSWLYWREESDRIRQEVLEPLVWEYYDIDKYEAMLIEDTHDYAVKSYHPKRDTKNIPTLHEAKEKDKEIYAQTLCEMLNNFGKGSSFKVNGEIIQGNPYSVVQVSLVDKIRKSIPVEKSKDKLAKIFNRMEPLLEEKQGRFVFCKNLKVFDGNDLYILKPMQMRFWTRTAALNDADEIAGALLKS